MTYGQNSWRIGRSIGGVQALVGSVWPRVAGKLGEELEDEIVADRLAILLVGDEGVVLLDIRPGLVGFGSNGEDRPNS